MAKSLQYRIEQAEARVADTNAGYEKERNSLKKDLRKARALKNPADRKSKLSLLNMKADALENAADEVLKAQDNLIAVLDEDLRGGYEKMRGLLSYGIAMGAANPDARLLFDSLGDYLEAKSDSDRKAAGRAVSLCLQHGNLGGKDDEPVVNDEVLRRFEGMSDGEERTAFYQKHRAEILQGFEARKNNP